MSHLDPNGFPVVPHGRPWQPDETDGDGPDAWGRARHPGAAPEPYAPDDGYRADGTGDGAAAGFAPEAYPRSGVEPDPESGADGYAQSAGDPYARSGGDPYTRSGGDPYAGPGADPDAWPGVDGYARPDSAGRSAGDPNGRAVAGPPGAEGYGEPYAGSDPNAPTGQFPTLTGPPGPGPAGLDAGPGASPAADNAGADKAAASEAGGHETAAQGTAAQRTAGDDGSTSGPRPTRGRRRAGRRPTEQSATGRAGRNLPAAIGVGLGLVALVLGPLFLWRPAFVAVIAVAVAVGTWEMIRAVATVGARPPAVPLFAGGLLTVVLAWTSGPDALCLGLLVTVLAAAVWRAADGPDGYLRDLTAATLTAVYVPFLAGFAVLLATPDDGRFRVLVTLAAVVFSDTGGYLFGVLFGTRLFGDRPMAPTISPKKSWEGFAGSVGTTAVGSAVLLWLLLDVAPWQGALFGAALSVAAVLGDLAESMLKRDLGVKDMSDLLPGHGGLMDRLDSILLAVPVAYLALLLIAPPT